MEASRAIVLPCTSSCCNSTFILPISSSSQKRFVRMCSKVSVPWTSNEDENLVLCIVPPSPHAFTSVSSCTSLTSDKSSQLPSSARAVDSNNAQERTWLPYPQRLDRTRLENGRREARCRYRRGRCSQAQRAGWLACRWSLTTTS